MPLIRECQYCHKEFRCKPSWVKNGGGKYCSVKCQRLASRKGRMVDCFLCGKQIYKSRKDILKSNGGKLFCSSQCSNKWLGSVRQGNNHPNWKGGEFVYKEILKRYTTSMICTLCGKDDKRILVAHHIDRDRQNNKLENLAWLCHNCHHLVHHYQEANERFGVNLAGLRYG